VTPRRNFSAESFLAPLRIRRAPPMSLEIAAASSIRGNRQRERERGEKRASGKRKRALGWSIQHKVSEVEYCMLCKSHSSSKHAAIERKN